MNTGGLSNNTSARYSVVLVKAGMRMEVSRHMEGMLTEFLGPRWGLRRGPAAFLPQIHRWHSNKRRRRRQEACLPFCPPPDIHSHLTMCKLLSLGAISKNWPKTNGTIRISRPFRSPGKSPRACTREWRSHPSPVSHISAAAAFSEPTSPLPLSRN